MGDLRKRLAAGACLATTVLSGTVLVTPHAGAAGTATAVSQERATPAPTIRAGSFNVRHVRHEDDSKPGEAPWRERRKTVIRQILSQRVDVVGIQEASQNGRYRNRLVDGSLQYLDLRNGLNRAGGSFALTNADISASRTTRILYDTKKLSMLREGSYRFHRQNGGPNDDRFMVWAVFQHRSSGKRFFFANTHLANKSGEAQQAQWYELIHQVNTLKAGLPVVVVGDFQRSKFKSPANTMMSVMRANGYGDVVGMVPNQAAVPDPRARNLRRAWINSMSNFNRNVADFAFEDRRKEFTGASPDWIFASNHLPVKSFEVVVQLNERTMRLTGTIPSDHSMVRASIVLR